MHLETGQEPADALLRFIADVERDNLFINFDPANMILYGSGEPIDALREGRPLRAQRPLQGRQVGQAPRARSGAPKCRLGEGDVGMEHFLRTLDEIGYTGPLTIEREIPQEPGPAKGRDRPGIGPAERIEGESGLASGL